MSKYIAWYGVGVRELHGFQWKNGEVHLVEDEMVALDILTQPDEDFREVDPATKEPVAKPKRKAQPESANS